MSLTTSKGEHGFKSRSINVAVNFMPSSLRKHCNGFLPIHWWILTKDQFLLINKDQYWLKITKL